MTQSPVFPNVECEADHPLRLPEHSLLVSILAAAISDAAGVGQSVGLNTAQEKVKRQYDAIRWLLSEDVWCSPERGISFQFICEELSLDGAAIRERVMQRSDSLGDFMTVLRDRSHSHRHGERLRRAA